MNAPLRRPFQDLHASQQAGILCSDIRFQSFAAMRCGFPRGQFSHSEAAEYIRQICRVQSRTDIAKTRHSLEQFKMLLTEFDAHIGKIARPR